MTADHDWPVRPVANRNAALDAQDIISRLSIDDDYQCSHPSMDGQNPRLRNWRTERAKWREFRFQTDAFVPENCARPARYVLFDKPYCERHAGRVLLDLFCSALGVVGPVPPRCGG